MRRIKYADSSDGLLIGLGAMAAVIYLTCLGVLGWVAFHYIHKFW